MAISKEEARNHAENMIKESGKNLRITAFESLRYINGDGLYFFSVQDRDTGKNYYPGELFKAIRMSDGALVDFKLPTPTF